MNFSTYCFKCEKYVMASTICDSEELLSALENGADVEVCHIVDHDNDHCWKLAEEEKQYLLRRMKVT